MRKTFRYTQQAPVIPLDVISPIHGGKRRIKFRVDTGADMTIIPGALVPELGTRAFNEIIMADYDSRQMRYKAHVIHLALHGRLFENVEVVASETDTAYLGLDILNQPKLTLDGPKKQLVVH
jgi:hypothetical protein